MYGCGDDLEERSGCNLDVSFVLLNILTDGSRRIHIKTVTWGHLFHDLDQGLNQTSQVVITVNLRK